ncbi:maleylpyruvate isomerase family mycothiol-dependent enzyme [Nocardioides sp.]|uniref:maleylpyruvate isomerase family mycothiol-dependent enzyme n=1 Tax=Nocardioides sp. TaxID=35761 RepID=UPI002719C373|nr:maleylpyruvate isomerase family mycothiol-dependent enzyme [Nocardioides sp.]MDO9457758.1 maleylpyruvate isomerase family mycothiol-dependent enzyme [Nocardioides sp.]
MAPNDDLAADLADERRALADLLESLTPEQWQTQTLCAAWDVHQMAAHLLAPTEGSTGLLLRLMVRSRGNVDRLGLLVTEHFADLPPEELVARIRANAEVDTAPPFVGMLGPYTDALVHGEDIRIPLGIVDDRPPTRWEPSLDFLLSRRARFGFLPSAAPALTYAATDLTWTRGAGPRVEAPAAALALALTGRAPRLDELVGPGARLLRAFALR